MWYYLDIIFAQQEILSLIFIRKAVVPWKENTKNTKSVGIAAWAQLFQIDFIIAVDLLFFFFNFKLISHGVNC